MSSAPIISNCKLFQNYPNPFNNSTVISFELKDRSYIELDLFNILGENVFTIYKGMKSSGYHQITINLSSLSTGVYYYKLKAGELNYVRKCISLK